VATLQQERWVQHLDGDLNRWGIMTINGSESLNNVFRIAGQLSICAIVENTWQKYVEWFIYVLPKGHVTDKILR
jgi:hypothetical protein